MCAIRDMILSTIYSTILIDKYLVFVLFNLIDQTHNVEVIPAPCGGKNAIFGLFNNEYRIKSDC